MKKILKKGSVFFLAMIMVVISVVPVMAAETDVSPETEFNTGYEVYVEEFILAPGESITEEDLSPAIKPLATIDQTFTIGAYHRGADRTYSTSKLKFMITVTDTNGNGTSGTLSLGFQDYYANYSAWLIDADGSSNIYNDISIVAGRTYYFTYYNNTSVNLRIHMVITNY